MGSKNRLDLLRKLNRARTKKSSKELLDEELDKEEASRVYDLVDEGQFRDHKRQELLHDDFVVDDDGKGYVDKGIDEWDERYQESYYSSDENSLGDNERGNKRKQSKIGEMINRAQSIKQIHPRENKNKKMEIDGFDDILNEFEVKPIGKLSTIPNSKESSFLKRILHSNRGIDGNKRTRIDTNLGFETSEDSPFLDSSPLKRRKSGNIQKKEQDVKKLLRYIEDSPTMIKPLEKKLLSEEDDSEEEIQFGRKSIRSVPTTRQINFNSKTISQPSSPFTTAPGTPLHAKINYSSSQSPLLGKTVFGSKFTKDQIVDQITGKFRFFWLDYDELDTSLVLFGKIKTNTGVLISAMIQVSGLYKELYFLPRTNKTPNDVHDEIIPLLIDKYGLDHIRAKPETKKYAFELPNIPKKAEYLKVLLPYETSKSKNINIPSELEGESFCHVFGGNTNIFESFVMQRKIMGPSWLEISHGIFDELTGTSHCAVEILVSDPQNIIPFQDKMVPDLNCISLSVQTLMNPKENNQEIVSITMSTYKNLPLDSPVPDHLEPNDIVTLVRPIHGLNFPPGLATLSKKELKSQIRLFNNEKTLLNCFCALMKVSDPDVIIGHRLENISLDVICHRAFELKVPTFSSFGRRVRKTWPDKFNKNNSNMNQFYIRIIFSGRLLCDISNEMGQSLTPKCQSWELSEMYQVACQKDHKALEVNFSNPQYKDDANLMVLALQENIMNSLISAEVAFRIQILSLTKQLTNLAGNAWSQTLAGTRAGRNEYILLHEFIGNNYIVPDKESRQIKHGKRDKLKGKDGSTDHYPVSSKKSNYQGGLVFEPEKGLHKNYVLVMDFNSLYPSIIQEFNICFTTIERSSDNIDELPELPYINQEQGILPRLLANLVKRRCEVKKIMKSETDPHKKAQCDVRQQALKLTANSMYGCLGYINSRFYAKPLAMLVTNKGREILMNTRQLAESLSLVVVYGDTDSVMIDSGCDSYKEAIKIGENFKNLVNESYKLLEIDIDNVFKKLLLHAKKKYAALNVKIDNTGNETTLLEVKGLDMRRREYCPLSKEVSTQVLNTILSDKDPEIALQEIYEFMETIKVKIENNEIRMDKYKINTKLSKDPKSYPGGKNMPAVQVALRMREAGRVVKIGSVITFVITKQDNDENGHTLSPAERARALNEVMIKANNLQPDPKYYLEKQIFAPVERLLEKIESFDIIRLSESLGLDSRRYINRIGPNGELNIDLSETLHPLESTISDMERFKDSANFDIECSNCQTKFPFGGIVASTYYRFTHTGIQCKKCDYFFNTLQITCLLEKTIRSHISLYYAGWLQCDDSTCDNVTRQISVFGKRCLNENCTGVIRYRYTDKQLYNQLLYFESLFDIEKNKKQQIKPLYFPGDSHIPTDPLTVSEIAALSEQNRELLDINKSIIEKYLSNCGRRYVDMGNIFDFME